VTAVGVLLLVRGWRTDRVPSADAVRG
jgi:hypothetical protein